MRRLFLSATLLWIAASLAALLPSHVHAQTSPYPNAPAVSAAKAEESKVFVLRWIKPSRFIEQFSAPSGKEEPFTHFLLSPGISRMSPDDATNRLVLRGTPDAINTIDEIVRLLDVEPRRVRIIARIMRAPAMIKLPIDKEIPLNISMDDKPLSKSEALTTVTGAFSNNETQTFSAIGAGQLFRLQFTPHINGDDSVSVSTVFFPLPTASSPRPINNMPMSNTDSQAQDQKFARITTMRILNGATGHMLYTPIFQNRDMAYYLEVTPFVQPRQEQP